MKLLSKQKLCSCPNIEIYKTLVYFICCIQMALFLIILANCIYLGFNYFPKRILIRFCDVTPNMSITNYEEVLNSFNKIKQVILPISKSESPKPWLKTVCFRQSETSPDFPRMICYPSSPKRI